MKIQTLLRSINRLPKSIQIQALQFGLNKALDVYKGAKRSKSIKKKVKLKPVQNKGNKKLHIINNKTKKIKTIKKMAKRRAGGYYRRSNGMNGMKNRVSKFMAGVGAKKLLGGGLFGLGAAYILSDVEGVAGVLVGDNITNILSGVLGGGAAAGSAAANSDNTGVIGA